MDKLVRQDDPALAPPPPSATMPSASGTTAPWRTEEPSPELGRYLAALVEARGRITTFVLGTALFTVLLAFVLPRQWTANVVLLPTDDAEGALPAQISGLVSSFGFQFPFGPASQSDLFPTILTSDRLLGAALDLRFRSDADAPEATLLDILQPDGDDVHARRMKAIRQLRKRVVQAAKDSETGIVSLEVTTRDPALSAGLANALVAQLEAYLITIRQNEGRKNRTFIDERLDEVSKELALAETQLTRFREANRRITGSPELQLEEARLHRDVLMQEQVYLELQKQKEIAEIEEVKNTPVLKILDEATPPVRPSRPMRTLMVAGGILVGLFVAVSWVLLRESLRESPDLAVALAPLSHDVARARGLFRRRPLSRAARAA